MFKQQSPARLFALTLMAGTALVLTGCQSTGTTGAGAAPATEQSAAPAQHSLGTLESQYKKNPDDVNVAIRYARALRENDRLSRASIIIAPFAKNSRKPSSAAKAEYAAIQAALGNYTEADDFATKAIALDSGAYQAYHIQGIALDAKGDHAGAEKAYRKALDLWQGDSTPVMNNLGLNLASQGFLDEASEILRKALETSPDRVEIERNLRIVDALRESGGRAPSYIQKERDKQKASEAAAADKASGKKITPTPVMDDEPAAKPASKQKPTPTKVVN